MNTNQRAIHSFETQNYKKAKKLFKKAVFEERNVQSLTNLAWYLSREEGEDEFATSLLVEALALQPTSHFPYSLLGHIYLINETYEKAEEVLTKSLAIQDHSEAHMDLGVLYYNHCRWEKAANHFLRASDGHDYAYYCYMIALAKWGKYGDVKKHLREFKSEKDEFLSVDVIGEVELAEIYAMIGMPQKAIELFDVGFQTYAHESSWVCVYIDHLLLMDQLEKAQQLMGNLLKTNHEELKEAYKETIDEDYTEEEKQEYIDKILCERTEYETLIQRIQQGYHPSVQVKPSSSFGCFLFGCTRHNHPTY